VLLSAEVAVSKTLADAEVAVSKTLADADWPFPLPAAGSPGITAWARVAALPGVPNLVVPESARALASDLGLPISSAGYGGAPSREDDEEGREDAGNGAEASDEGDLEAAEDAQGAGAADAGAEESDAGTEEEDDAGTEDDEPVSHSDALHVDVSQEKPSPSSSAAPEGAAE
jgi:hypothetical protein